MTDELNNSDGEMAGEEECGLFVRIPQRDYAVMKRQFLASHNLYAYLREVACENKRLLQRNENLQKAVIRTGKQISEIVMHRSRHADFSEFSSLPPNLHDHRFNQEQRVQDEMKKLMYGVKENSELSNRGNLSPGSHLKSDLFRRFGNLSEGQIFFPPSMRIPNILDSYGEESKTLTEENETVGDDRDSSFQKTYSIKSSVSKQYFDIVVKELAKSKRFIQQLLIKNGEQPKEIMKNIHLKEMVHSLEERNSRLRESNHQLQILLESKSADPHELQHNKNIMLLHKQVQKLERQLQFKDEALDQLNKQCDSLKVSQQMTDLSRPSSSVQDKTEASQTTLSEEGQDVETQKSQQTTDLSQSTSNVQVETEASPTTTSEKIKKEDHIVETQKNSQQTADLSQTISSEQINTEDQVVETQVHHCSCQTDVTTSNQTSVSVQTEDQKLTVSGKQQTDVTTSNQTSVSVQTDDQELTVSGKQQTDDVAEADVISGVSEMREISDNKDSRITELEEMLANLMEANNDGEQRFDALQRENKMLEKNYKQLLQSMVDVERNHDAAHWKEEKAALECDLSQIRSALKEKNMDAKYSMARIQTLQHELGTVNMQKTKLEARLKKETGDYKKQELQLLNQCRSLQDQFDRVLFEKNKLQASINVATAGPHFSSGPRSLACVPKNIPWQQTHGELSLVADSDQSMATPLENLAAAPLENVVVAESENLNVSMKEFVCRHCLRTDFSSLESFQAHLKKCGD